MLKSFCRKTTIFVRLFGNRPELLTGFQQLQTKSMLKAEFLEKIYFSVF